jgi:hypothetical protein
VTELVFKRVISKHFDRLGENAGVYAVGAKGKEVFLNTAQEAKKWVDLGQKSGATLFLVNIQNKTTDASDKEVYKLLNTVNKFIPWSRGDWVKVTFH